MIEFYCPWDDQLVSLDQMHACPAPTDHQLGRGER